jgi:signal transduction histidine kinase
MRLSLRTKVILTVSLFLVVIFALIMYLSLTRNTSQLRGSLNEQSKSFASLATPPIGNVFLLYQDSGSIRINQQVDKFLALDPDVTAVRIVAVDGAQLYDSRNRQNPPLSAKLAGAFEPQYVKNQNGYISQVVQPFFEDSGAHRYSVVYEISTERAEQSNRNAARLVLYVGVAILLVSIAATVWALNVLFLKPLREVSRSANSISAGNYNQQIVSKSRDEIGDLAKSVNTMAESLKGDIEKLRELDKLKSEFLMIASHNLRTPLTVMRGYIEMAEQATTANELRAIVKTIQESVVRLHLLSEDLLTISTLESGGEMMAKSPVVAKDFIDAAVSDFALLADKKHLQWQFSNDLPADAKLEISQSNMRSALGNIIDNAIKFTKESGSVRITAQLSGQQLVFTVADTGIGIQPEELPKLFTMFHRGTGTMHYDYEGAGIGLYLTKLIVEKHNGRVMVHSQAGQGATFTVSLPLALSTDASAPTAPAGRRPGA